jgi:FkbM family methyltransferase
MSRLMVWTAGHMPPHALRWVSSLRYRFPVLAPWLSRAGDMVRGRDAIIQHGIGKGLRFNCGPSMAGYVFGYMEEHVQEILTEYVKPGMVAYDIGANVGFLSILMARLVGPTGQIVCFEPMPQNAQAIRHNVELNDFKHVVVREEAVGDHEGQVSLMVDHFSSNHRLELTGKKIARQEGTITVQLRNLDSPARVAPELRPPNLIKMDAEGVEVMILRGAKELLARARPVMLIELHGTNREMAEVLREIRYDYKIVGNETAETRSKPLEEAHWNVHILATPKD